MQLLASLIGIILLGISFDIMCSWRMCHMAELSYKIGTLDYWDIGEKHQVYTLMWQKVTFTSVFGKRKTKMRKG